MAKSIFLFFLILMFFFFGSLLSLGYIYIFEISITFWIKKITNMTYFKRNVISEGPVFHIFGHKTPNKEETAKNKYKNLF
jgi:hypothetical protein